MLDDLDNMIDRGFFSDCGMYAAPFSTSAATLVTTSLSIPPPPLSRRASHVIDGCDSSADALRRLIALIHYIQKERGLEVGRLTGCVPVPVPRPKGSKGKETKGKEEKWMEDRAREATEATDRVFGWPAMGDGEDHNGTVNAAKMALEDIRARTALESIRARTESEGIGVEGNRVRGGDQSQNESSNKENNPLILVRNTISAYSNIVETLVEHVTRVDCPMDDHQTPTNMCSLMRNLNSQQTDELNISLPLKCKSNVPDFSPTAPRSQAHPKRHRSSSFDVHSLQRTHSGDGNSAPVPALLRLLTRLVRLKESTGQGRALLAVLLSLPNGLSLDDVPGGMTYGDLAFKIEAQGSHMKALKECCSSLDRDVGGTVGIRKAKWEGVRMLVEESITAGVELLASVQERVMKNFDLKGVRETTSFAEYWHCSTIYMDRLHSLELFLIGEIEGQVLNKNCKKTSPFIFSSDSKEDVDLAGSLESRKIRTCDESDYEALGDLVTNFSSSLKMAISIYVRNLPNHETKESISDMSLDDLISSMSPELVKDALSSAFSQSRTGTAPISSLNRVLTRKENEFDKEGNINDSFMECCYPKTLGVSEKMNEWDVDLYEVKFVKRIGSGGAGTTYLGIWDGQDVAIKVAAMNDVGMEGWSKEVRALQHIHHPNVIRLLGSIQNQYPPTYCLVLEYCDAGDLLGALQGPTPPDFFEKVTTSVAAGMKYLHKQKFIHRDLTPGNILLHGDVSKSEFTVKVTDFGNATKLVGDSTNAVGPGTFRWMAPEAIRHEKCCEKADVYSFSIIMWQLITHEIPFAHQTPLIAAGQVAFQNVRPPFPVNTPLDISTYIAKCWHENQSSRPSFTEVENWLLNMKHTMGTNNYETSKRWLGSATGHPVYTPGKNEKENLINVENVEPCENETYRSEDEDDGQDFESNLLAIRQARKLRKKKKFSRFLRIFK